jgi:plastocyanin
MRLSINSKLKKTILLLSVSIMMLVLGCNKSTDYSTNPPGNVTPGANEILIQNMAFSPAGMTVNLGTTIKWTNKDNVPHTVTSGTPGSPSGLFDSGNMALNGNFTYTFNQTGTFKYYCTVHPMMTATIIVQ